MAEALIEKPPVADARTTGLLREVEWKQFSYAVPAFTPLNPPKTVQLQQMSPTLMQRMAAKMAKKQHLPEKQPMISDSSSTSMLPVSPATAVIAPLPSPSSSPAVALVAQLTPSGALSAPVLPPKPKPKAGTSPALNQSVGPMSCVAPVSKSEPDSPNGHLDGVPAAAIQRPLSLKQLFGASNRTRHDDPLKNAEASQRLLDDALEMDDMGDNADGHSSESSLLDCRPLNESIVRYSAARDDREADINGVGAAAALSDRSPSSGPPSRSSLLHTSNAASHADEHI